MTKNKHLKRQLTRELDRATRELMLMEVDGPLLYLGKQRIKVQTLQARLRALG